MTITPEMGYILAAALFAVFAIGLWTGYQFGKFKAVIEIGKILRGKK